VPDIEPDKLAGLLLILAFPCLLAVAAAGDLARYRIGNGLNITLALLYFPAAFVVGSDIETTAWHLGAGTTVLAVGLVLFVLDRLGGGDVKLLAAAACWTGFSALPAFLIYVALSGGVLALFLLLARKLLANRLSETSSLARLFGATRDVPYGLAIAFGGFATLPRLDLIRSLLAS
jgi:prepilin peptidase CpaA